MLISASRNNPSSVREIAKEYYDTRMLWILSVSYQREVYTIIVQKEVIAIFRKENQEIKDNASPNASSLDT